MTITERVDFGIYWLEDNYDPGPDLNVLMHPGNLPKFEIERIANKILRSGKVSVEELQKICDNIVKGGRQQMENEIRNEQKDINTLMGNAEYPGFHDVIIGIAKGPSINGETCSLEAYYSRMLDNSNQHD